MKSFHHSSRRVVAMSAVLVGWIAILGVVPSRLVAAGSDDNGKDAPTIIRSLIPEAAGIPKADWEALTFPHRDRRVDARERLLESKDIPSHPLTMVLLTLKAPQPRMPVSKDFRFLKSPVPTGELRAALGKGHSPGYASLIHADDITDFTCVLHGDSATGTVSFRVEGLYEGKAEYTAKRENGQWRVDEFRLPDYKIRVVRGQNGLWARSPVEN